MVLDWNDPYTAINKPIKITTTFSEPNERGRKYDSDKAPVVQGCFNYFPRALKAVAEISKYGANKYETKYEEKNWEKVEDGFNRYTDATGRHLIDEAIDGLYDKESKILHAAHNAWNALARLEILLKNGTPLTITDEWLEGIVRDQA